jgi:hypothetical protein
MPAQRREEPGGSSPLHTDPAALAEAIRQTDAQLATAQVVLQTMQDRLAVCAPREMADLQTKVEASQRRRSSVCVTSMRSGARVTD